MRRHSGQTCCWNGQVNAARRAKLATLATITLSIMEEDQRVRGNAMHSGDDAEDKAVEDAILARLNKGELWAWCTVRVMASYAGLEQASFLGGCSYEDEAEFRFQTDPYDMMVAEALDALAKEVDRVAEALAALDTDLPPRPDDARLARLLGEACVTIDGTPENQRLIKQCGKAALALEARL